MSMNNNWVKDKYARKWLEQIISERTKYNYKERFPLFLEWIKQTPTQIVESRIQHLVSTDITKRELWEQKLVEYTRYLETLKNDDGKRRLGVASVKGYQNAVRSFFAKNRVRLQFSRNELAVEPAEREKVVKEWIPSNEEIRMIYRACKSARDRSVLLVLYQSGFSEVDVSNMKVEDFDFYDKNDNWKPKPYTDVYHARLREKTSILQQTCISREAIEDIRIMLQNRGFPEKGYLFVSQKNKQFTPRFIHAMLKPIVNHHLAHKADLWKSKHLRDSFMNALLKAKITQEVKDCMVGHKRKGARADYAISEDTITETYDSAFKHLTVNGVGSSTRKIEQLEQETKQQTITA